jgi:Ca2+/Na+ antiporter
MKNNIYRSGEFLVVHKDALLPDRCIKTNEPAKGCRIKRHFKKTNPIIFILYVIWQVALINGYLPFIGWPLFIGLCILGFYLTKRATIQLGVSEQIRTKKIRSVKISLSCFLTAILATVLGILFMVKDPSQILLIYGVFILGFLAFTTGLLLNADSGKLVSLKKFKDDYLWLCGAGSDYLDSLPDWSQRKENECD